MPPSDSTAIWKKDAQHLQRPKLWSDERTRRVDHHRSPEFMTGEEVSNSTTSHTEKRTSSQSVEEPADQHRLSILGHSTWNQPYQEDGERDYVDISASVELVKPSVIDSDLSRREGRIDGIDVLRTEEQGIVDRFLPRRSHHQLLCDEPQHLKPLTETPNECRQAQRRNFSAHSEFFCQLIICGRIHGRRACPTTISLVWYQTSSAVRRRQGATQVCQTLTRKEIPSKQ